MEYCDLGSLDSAIADARFKDLVSRYIRLRRVTYTRPCRTLQAADGPARVGVYARGDEPQEELHMCALQIVGAARVHAHDTQSWHDQFAEQHASVLPNPEQEPVALHWDLPEEAHQSAKGVSSTRGHCIIARAAFSANMACRSTCCCGCWMLQWAWSTCISWVSCIRI